MRTEIPICAGTKRRGGESNEMGIELTKILATSPTRSTACCKYTTHKQLHKLMMHRKLRRRLFLVFIGRGICQLQ